MSPREANAVLALAGQFDGRKPDIDTATMWAEALSGLRLEDCQAAVRAHYRDSTDWLMPAAIRRRVNAIRADRIERGKPFLKTPDWLDELDGDAHTLGYQRWLAGEYRALADGNPPNMPPVLCAPIPADVRAGLTATFTTPPEHHDEETT